MRGPYLIVSLKAGGTDATVLSRIRSTYSQTNTVDSPGYNKTFFLKAVRHHFLFSSC